MACGPRGLLQALQAGLLDRRDLLAHHRQPRQVAPELLQRVGRDRQALRRAHCPEAFRRTAQLGLEAANAEPGQGALHAVDDAGAFADQALALAAWPLGVLLLGRGHRDHPAVPPLATQPAQEHPHQHRRVEPVRLRPLVLARDRHACRVDDMHLDPARAQPSRQPEAVAASLVRDRDPGNRAPGPGRFVLPTQQQSEQGLLVRVQLLQRPAVDTWNGPGDQPTRLAQLDHGDQRVVLLERDKGPAQIVRLGHGAYSMDCCLRRWCSTLAACPIASQPGVKTDSPCRVARMA